MCFLARRRNKRSNRKRRRRLKFMLAASVNVRQVDVAILVQRHFRFWPQMVDDGQEIRNRKYDKQ